MYYILYILSQYFILICEQIHLCSLLILFTTPAFFTNNKVTPFLAGIPHKNRARASREPEKYPILQIKLPQSGNVPLCAPFQKA